MTDPSNQLFRPSYVQRMARMDETLNIVSQVGACIVILTCVLAGKGLGTEAAATGYLWLYITSAETLALITVYALMRCRIRRFQAQHPKDYALYRTTKAQS